MSVFVTFYAVRRGREFFNDKEQEPVRKGLYETATCILSSVVSTIESMGREVVEKGFWDPDKTSLTQKQINKLDNAPYIEKALSKGLEKVGLSNGHLVDLRMTKYAAKIGMIICNIAGFSRLAKVCHVVKKGLCLYLNTEPLRSGKFASLKNRDFTTNKGQRALIMDALSIIATANIIALGLSYIGVISAETLAITTHAKWGGKKVRKIWAVGHAVKLFEKIEWDEKPNKTNKRAFIVAKNILNNVGMDLHRLQTMPKVRESLSLTTGVMAYLLLGQWESFR